MSDGPRFALTRWSAAADPVSRLQLDGDNASIETLAAGFLQGTIAARPAASAANVGFLYEAIDQGGILYWSTGAAWIRAAPLAIAESFTTTTVVNTGADTAVVSAQVPANGVAAGDLIRLSAFGDMLSNGGGSSTSITWRLKFGATTLFAAAHGVADNVTSRRHWRMQAEFIAASTASQRVAGTLAIPGFNTAGEWTTFGFADTGASGPRLFVGYGIAAEDTTTAKNFALTVQMDIANPSRDVRAHGWKLERVRAA